LGQFGFLGEFRPHFVCPESPFSPHPGRRNPGS
jgi:hypothetical protein